MACCTGRNRNANSRTNKYGCQFDDVRARYTGPAGFVHTKRNHSYRTLETGQVLCIQRADQDEDFFEVLEPTV